MAEMAGEGRGQAGGAEVTGTGRAMGTEVWYREFLLRVRGALGSFQATGLSLHCT